MRKSNKLTLTLSILFLSLTLTISPAASGLAQNEATFHVGPQTLILLDPVPRPRYEPPHAAFLRRLSSPEQTAAVNIVVNYNGPGWTGEAQAAFEYAVSIWETLITSPIPIIVDADFRPLGPGVLGGAGPTIIARDFTNAPQANTWYPIATANKLANTDLSPEFSDIEASFSSSYRDWHFGTGSSTPVNKISFVSVVLHEIGHGLGFLGSMQVDDGIGSHECNGIAGRGCYGISGFPMIYDRYTENGSGTALLSFSNNSANLGSELTSNDLFFDSTRGNFANGGNRVPIYAPSSWNQGSSYSHLAQSFDATAHALMTYSISKGETIHNPGSVTLCMFSEMGWTVAETCEPTPISGLIATNDGPTILGNATQLMANISNGSNVTYEWDFGDGSNADGAVVSHTYASPGTYTAEVTATNSVDSDTATTIVYVDEMINGLAAANDGPTILGESTQLTATISNGSNVTYEWDFGDGSNANGAVVSHTYASPGTYTAEITATNSVDSDIATTIVHVDETISGLAAANDGPTILGESTQLTANISNGSNVTYEWDFGDGSNADGAVVSHSYASPGSYIAEVTATNSVDADTATTIVYVEEAISGLSAVNDGPTLIGDYTRLSANISTGSNVIYEWDFGDGNSGLGAEVTHLYTTTGTYTAEITAMNLIGQETATTKVKVLEITERIFIPILVKP